MIKKKIKEPKEILYALREDGVYGENPNEEEYDDKRYEFNDFFNNIVCSKLRGTTKECHRIMGLRCLVHNYPFYDPTDPTSDMPLRIEAHTLWLINKLTSR